MVIKEYAKRDRFRLICWTLMTLLWRFAPVTVHAGDAKCQPSSTQESRRLFEMIEDPSIAPDKVTAFMAAHLETRDSRNEQCEPPLFAAIRTKRLPLVRAIGQLLGEPWTTRVYRADPPRRYAHRFILLSPYQYNALEYSLFVGTLEIAEYLDSITYRAGPNLFTQGRFVAAASHFNVEELKTILAKYNPNHQIDVNSVALFLDLKITPLMAAAGENTPEVVRFLVESGADRNAYVSEDQTPLSIAANVDAVDNVAELLKLGADPNAHDLLAPREAIYQNSLNALGLLLENGVDVNAQTPQGASLLWHAVGHESWDAFRFLLAHSADYSFPKYGIDAHKEWNDLAAITLSADAFRILKETVVPPLGVFDRAFGLSFSCWKSLYSDDATTFSKFLNFLDFLLGFGKADINRSLTVDSMDIICRDRLGITNVTPLTAAVHGASWSDPDGTSTALVHFLLDHGANVNSPPEQGCQYPLERAVYACSEKMVELLLRSGAEKHPSRRCAGGHCGVGDAACSTPHELAFQVKCSKKIQKMLE